MNTLIPESRWCVKLLTYLAITSPAAGWAVRAGGAVSNLPLPTVAYLRAYRAPFSAPARIAVDTAGNVYVTDPGQGQVIVRAPNGRIVSRRSGLGRPVSIAVTATGRICVGDSESGRVTAFSPDWQPVLQLGRGAGEFLLPNDLAVDAATGNLYVADSAAHLVKVYSAAGVFLQSFGGPGSGDGQFNFPVGVFVDVVARQVLVVDQLNYRVQVFDIAGTFQSCFGAQGSGPGEFNMPQGVSVDGQGRIYVADSLEGHIQVLDGNGDFVGYIGDFGEAAGQLRIPMDLVIDPSNRLFVTAANNARLEMFGLDTFADPETFTPAVIDVEPNPIERADPASIVVGYVEVPAYALDRIVPGSIVANGVAAATTPIIVADHDGNGVPDARVEFDRATLLATLPADGAGTIAISGTIAGKQFEGSAVVQITTCGPGTLCSLGDADPQCNEAACVAPIGCTMRPKTDGTGCEDGNACTVGDECGGGVCAGASLSCDDGNVCTDDSCDAAGGCVHANNTAPCDDGSACTVSDTCAEGACSGAPFACDDGNICTDDSCNPSSGCVHVGNRAPCNDESSCTVDDACAGGVCSGAALACNDGNICTEDSCDPASGCVHVDTVAPCDDGSPGTVRDACSGMGKCVGQVVTGNYAVLSSPPESPAHRSVTLSTHVLVRGDVCGERMAVGSSSQIEGDAVASASGGWAIMLGAGSQIAGSVVTGGGRIVGIERGGVDGRVDRSGVAMELAECLAARYRANIRRADLTALASTPGSPLGAIELEPGASRRLSSKRRSGTSQSVFDATDLRLGASSTLTLVGTGANAVVVRIHGRMMLGRAARIQAEGLQPEQVMFVVDGSVTLQSHASVAGSVFAAGKVRLGTAGAIAGALLGSDIDLAPYATVDLHPFVGW